MNTAYFQYFIEVCDCGSIAAAADSLYLSRQSLTTAINRLEKELGNVRLLTRHSNGVEMTKAGRYFYQRAKEQLAGWNDTVQQLQQLSRENVLSVGAPLFCLSESVYQSILAFERSHASVSVECRDMTYRHSRQCILNGTLDVGLVYRSSADSRLLDYEPVACADFCVLCRRQSPLARLKEADFSDLRGNDLLFVYGTDHLSPELEAQLTAYDLKVQSIPRNHSVLLSSIKTGKGVHILPELFAGTLQSDEIASVPFRMFPRR